MKLSFYKQQVRDQIHAHKEDSSIWLFWFIVLPIVPLLAYMCLGFLKIMPSVDGISRHLYIVIGITTWLLLTDAFLMPYRSVLKYQSYFLRQEVSFTHLLTAWLPERLIAAALQYTFCIFLISYNASVTPHAAGIYLAVNITAFLVFLTFGGLVGVIGLIYPSFINLIETTVRFLLFLSVVIFPLPPSSYTDVIKLANPFYVYIDASRNALLGLPIEWQPLLYWSLAGFIILIFLRGRLSAITPDVRDYLA
jgi:lipopolysaccharide transport system permease protein